MDTKTKISGIILAGGKSSRMGKDKASLKLGDTTFIEHIIDIMTPFVEEIIIISDNKKHDRFNIRREEDFLKDSGPLSGLYSGLYSAKYKNVLALSCDVPLISEDIISTLINKSKEDVDVNQIESNGKTMPLIALYKKSCWVPFHKLLLNDERRLRVAINSLTYNTIKIDNTYAEHVQNINTKDELKALIDGNKN